MGSLSSQTESISTGGAEIDFPGSGESKQKGLAGRMM